MAAADQHYHYDYTRLDNFFLNHFDPMEVASHLDTIRDRLVALVDHEEGYRETIRNDYTILGELRDILLHPSKTTVMEIKEIKERLTILEVLQHYNLQADKNNMLCCPFHDDKTPSLQIYPNTNTFCCFSSRSKAVIC